MLEMLRPSVTAKTIQGALPLIKPCHLPLTNHIRKATAVIKQPTGLSDNAVRFTAGLTVSVEVDAILENVQELQNIRLQVSCLEIKELYVTKTQKVWLLALILCEAKVD